MVINSKVRILKVHPTGELTKEQTDDCVIGVVIQGRRGGGGGGGGRGERRRRGGGGRRRGR